jgi:hypothetical protein
MVVHLPMAVDARPYVEELWELEAGVPEHRHHHSRAQKLKLRMETPSIIRSNTSLSRTSLHHPPNLLDVMAVQTQLMQRMAEAMEHRGNGGNHATPQDEDLTRKIERFIHLNAPTLSYSDNPVDVDDWLRVIETKLDLTVYSDKECVAIATHHLEGPAKAWWDNYTASHPNPVFIT